MLNNNQKRQLKTLGAKLTNKYQIGKNGLTPTLLDMLQKAIVAHELIKIDVMKAVETPVMEVALDLSSNLNADIVSVVGRTILLFKINKDNNKIKLVK